MEETGIGPAVGRGSRGGSASSSPTRTSNVYLLTKVSNEVVAGDAVPGRSVKIRHVTQTAADHHRRRHIACLLLKHGIESRGEGTVKRPPRSLLNRLVLHQYAAQHSEVSGEYPPAKSRATGT